MLACTIGREAITSIDWFSIRLSICLPTRLSVCVPVCWPVCLPTTPACMFHGLQEGFIPLPVVVEQGHTVRWIAADLTSQVSSW